VFIAAARTTMAAIGDRMSGLLLGRGLQGVVLETR
jgi:hypothetical protein